VCDEIPSRSTTVVFRKDDPADDWLVFPDTYQKMAAYFEAHTNLRYLFSSKPYTRWVGRMADLSRSRIRALAGAPNPGGGRDRADQ